MSACILLLLLPHPPAEGKDKWRRVYTMEDSVIDMNLSKVTFGLEKVGYVRFRTTFSRPLPVHVSPELKYKRVVETIELKCPSKLYRVIEATLFDDKGDPIRSDRLEPPPAWKTVEAASMMKRLFEPGCALIEKKRRNP